MSIFYLIAGVVLLVLGAELLVRASVGLSFKLQLSKLVIGMTVVSLATSAPELIVSFQAALEGHADLALGNVVGSNIVNIALVLGVTVIIMPIEVDRDFFRLNWPVMMLMSLLLFAFLNYSIGLNRVEGVLLVSAFIIFFWYIVRRAKNHRNDEIEDVDESLIETSRFMIVVWLLGGTLSLWYGSELLVDGATTIAVNLGISERVIGLSMVALGTSIPELAASVIAALRQEKSISLGNLIGSNIFNIGVVLGFTAIIQPIRVNNILILNLDLLWMLSIAFIILPMGLYKKKYQINRLQGLVLLSIYMIFIYISFLKG